MPPPPGSRDGSDEQRIRQPDADRPHVLVESGCIRELAAHILSRPETGTHSEEIDVHQTAFGPRQTAEIIQQLPDYDQLAAVLGTRGGCRLSLSRCTLAVAVDAGRYAWELLAFEITYPRSRTVYPVVGRRIDRPSDSVVTVIDPRPNAMAPNTAIVFEITTERIAPTPIVLDERLPSSDPSSARSATDIGYRLAIDWFVS